MACRPRPPTAGLGGEAPPHGGQERGASKATTRRWDELTREWTGGDKGTSRLRTEVLKGRILIMKRLGRK